MNKATGKKVLLPLLISMALAASVRADGPTTQPGDDQDYVISPMRVQELKGVNFEFISSKTTLAKLGEQIRQTMEKIQPAVKSGELKPAGAPLFIFHGVTQDPNSEFPLEVGFPVAEDAKPVDGLQIKKLETFRCATVLFSGSMQQVRHAYEKVYTDLMNAGLQPTDEGREAVLMFEGPDSVNNVALIEVGVQ